MPPLSTPLGGRRRHDCHQCGCGSHPWRRWRAGQLQYFGGRLVENDGVDGVWLAESRTTDLTGDAEFLPEWSGGGIYGYATLINVPEGTAVGYDAIAIADHVAADASGSDMHYKPGDIRPNFGDSALDTAAIVSVNGAAITVDFLGDYPSEATQRVQALNATMMASEIYNDYVTDPDIGAETDWLLTFPTTGISYQWHRADRAFQPAVDRRVGLRARRAKRAGS